MSWEFGVLLGKLFWFVWGAFLLLFLSSEHQEGGILLSISSSNICVLALLVFGAITYDKRVCSVLKSFCS